MTSQADGSDRQTLTERYGRPDPTRRRLGLVVIVVVAVVLVAWLVWAALAQSRSVVTGVVESYDVRSDHQVRVTVQVDRPSTASAFCVVTAIASDHVEVGRAVASVPHGGSTAQTVTLVIKTEREATTATVSRCR